jgi:hypothetical protein
MDKKVFSSYDEARLSFNIPDNDTLNSTGLKGFGNDTKKSKKKKKELE